MTFSETGDGTDIQANKSEIELNAELKTINQERCDHCKALENQWPNIPAEAIRYLAHNCPAPNLMTSVIAQLQTIVDADPKALSEPALIPFIIDDCILAASVTIADKQHIAEIETAKSLDTTAAVMSEINAVTLGLRGRAKLDAANTYLNTHAIPSQVREELSARFNRIGKTLDDMSAVFTDPGSQAEFQSIVNHAYFDLGAASITSTFRPILSQVDASDAFSNVQKIKLRQIVTGSDAQSVLRETITDENGITRPRYSLKHQRELRSGVSGYVNGAHRQMIEARAGDHVVTKDVSGWSGEDVGGLIEVMHMWNVLEGFGATGFVENIYKIDFSILGNGNAFDPMQVVLLRQVLSHLSGGFEGYDGDIANLQSKKTLIQNQARLISETQTAFGWENDRSGTQRTLTQLGLHDEKGNPNMDILKSFGDYTQRNYGKGAPDQLRLLEYLHKLHPAFVEPPNPSEKLA